MVVPDIPLVLGDITAGEGIVHAVLHGVYEGAGDVVELGHVGVVGDDLRPARHVNSREWTRVRRVSYVLSFCWSVNIVNHDHLRRLKHKALILAAGGSSGSLSEAVRIV